MSVALLIPWGSQVQSLAVSLALLGLPSISFTCFNCFVGGSAPPSLGVLGHAFLAFPWPSSAQSLSSFQALPGALPRLSPSWRDGLLQEISTASRTAWSGPSCLVQGGFLSLFVALTLEGLIFLLKALAELGRIDLPAVGISFGLSNGCVGQRSWRTLVLLLFDWQMSLVLSLLNIGGEEIMFYF